MTLKLIVEKLARSDKKFLLSDELKSDCRKLGMEYLVTVKYLTRNKYIVRIFKGIFYVYSLKERKLGTSEMTFHDILKEALRLKGVTNWYFGLETALKFNNLTHESFMIDYVMNDKIFRAKPITIIGRKVKFHKLAPKMMAFGIIKDVLPYSDPERTLLDLVYLKHYDLMHFNEMKNRVSGSTLHNYLKNYTRNVREIIQ